MSKENKSPQEMEEYAETKKTMQKKKRQKERLKRKEHIENILENGRRPKEVFKTSNKKIMTETKTEKGEIVTNRENILKICGKFL